MKTLLEMLSPEEREQYEKSLDASAAPTDAVRKKTAAVRDFLERHCFFQDEAAGRWGQSAPNARRKALGELIWRTSCIMDKSATAVMGMTKFDLGFGFKVMQTELEGKDVLLLL